MLEAVGYGAERPLVREYNDEQNRAQNRRVEFSMLVRRSVGQQVTY
jgi:outer membrane protein OmpA-like peptidoglycan-associated protein